MSNSDLPVILVVEDEPDVADTYDRWLQEYEVHRAETGEEALAQLDETVDVVLLDRMLPGMSGAEVLTEIRSRSIDCRVAMVTAVDPGFDIIEMGFDEYITKPPDREELRETVARLLHRATLNGDLQEYYSLVARRATLDATFPERQLEANKEYRVLVEQIEVHRAAVDDAMGDLASDADFIGAVREIMDTTNETEAPHDEEFTESTK
ncbi:response regulator transcription factor (plasmid) [Halorarum halophilum]|uniref:Response regulator transcription factor n=1 Tax=Halorarum halophilum TaxID=2743090 RepID=A0A7D5GHG9_9EURY|nr:response regulator transcription factor [Halobaculum halophilum]QLG29928.1 response regulator transcription factor [Halobaculum halophilum]